MGSPWNRKTAGQYGYTNSRKLAPGWDPASPYRTGWCRRVEAFEGARAPPPPALMDSVLFAQ